MQGRRKQRAFTLVEMSMVLIVIGLVIVVVFPALNAIRQSTQRQVTQSNLDTLLRASAAFVQSHGCLPCPTPASTVGTGFGYVRGNATGAACASCTQAEGIVPFASLGLPIGVAKDGWGRWITMRIDPALAINFGVVPPTSICLSSDPLPCVQGESRKGLCQGSLPSTNRITVTTPGATVQQAAILFLSHGANGFGAYHAGPLTNDGTNDHPAFTGGLTPCSATGGFERCNANSDAAFISGEGSNIAVSSFDDQLRYLGRDALVAYLGNVACQTTW